MPRLAKPKPCHTPTRLLKNSIGPPPNSTEKPLRDIHCRPTSAWNMVPQMSSYARPLGMPLTLMELPRCHALNP